MKNNLPVFIVVGGLLQPRRRRERIRSAITSAIQKHWDNADIYFVDSFFWPSKRSTRNVMATVTKLVGEHNNIILVGSSSGSVVCTVVYNALQNHSSIRGVILASYSLFTYLFLPSEYFSFIHDITDSRNRNILSVGGSYDIFSPEFISHRPHSHFLLLTCGHLGYWSQRNAECIFDEYYKIETNNHEYDL